MSDVSWLSVFKTENNYTDGRLRVCRQDFPGRWASLQDDWMRNQPFHGGKYSILQCKHLEVLCSEIIPCLLLHLT